MLLSFTPWCHLILTHYFNIQVLFLLINLISNIINKRNTKNCMYNFDTKLFWFNQYLCAHIILY
jgi:predicted membrane protein